MEEPIVALAAAILKPLAEKAWHWGGNKADEIKFELCFGGFQRFLENSYQKNSYFISMVFKNEQKKLTDYYLPLTIAKQPAGEEITIADFPHNKMLEYERLLIVDTAGMGKSTILKFLFISCVQTNSAIPIFIELRKLSKTKKILDFIVENAVDIDGVQHRDLIIKLIKAGKFVFLFDGYDEVAGSDRQDVANNISEFMAMAPANWYVMTSREEASLASFPQFQRFTIRPLTKEQAYTLLRRYDRGALVAEQLIKKLEEDGNQNIHEFLTNPMLTSLLFKSFEYKRSVPIRKHIFYRQVFEALFETHDLMKEEYRREKRSSLDIDQFEVFLRYFCYITYKDSKYEYSKEEFLTYSERTKSLISNQSIISSDIYYDLTHGVPLMVEEGNYLRWIHRSMQEFFAALWICRDCKDKQKETMIRMYKDRSLRHQNLLILCADIDPIAFKRSVIKEIAKSMLEEYNKSYTSRLPGINDDLVNTRKSLTTGKLFFIYTWARHQGITEIEERAENSKLVNTIDNYCKLRHIDYRGAGWQPVNNFSVGTINKEAQMLFIPQFRSLVPFVETTINLRHNDYPLLSALARKQFIPINDDADNVINKPVYFETINSLIESYGIWRFNANAAEAVLKQIKQEEDDSLDLAFI